MQLEYPIIVEDNQIVGVGGNQDWFTEHWPQQAGCASVSANDVYNYYVRKQTCYDKGQYVQYMEKMYQKMTPKENGYPYAYLYARTIKQELLQKGIVVNYTILRNPKYEKTVTTVKRVLDAGNPLGLLILAHRNPLLEDDIWHWVTIFGYQKKEDDLYITISDCGEKKEIPAGILFEEHCENYFKLVCFDKQ